MSIIFTIAFIYLLSAAIIELGILYLKVYDTDLYEKAFAEAKTHYSQGFIEFALAWWPILNTIAAVCIIYLFLFDIYLKIYGWFWVNIKVLILRLEIRKIKRSIRRRTTLFILLALIFGACVKDAQKVEARGNFEVELLFEHDGCKVYRFYDGRHIYYSDCRGKTEWEVRHRRHTEHHQVMTN